MIFKYFESHISFIKFVHTCFQIKSSTICWNNMNRRQTCWYTNLSSIQKWIRKIWLDFEFRWKFIIVRFCRFLMLLLDYTKTKTHIHRETHNHGTKIHTYLLNANTLLVDGTGVHGWIIMDSHIDVYVVEQEFESEDRNLSFSLWF